MSSRDDYLILGSGVIGLAIGIALLEADSRLRVRIVEKEFKSGLHASGRNSGVLHAGFYYSPDSLKARFCKEGNSELKKIASKHGVPVKSVGKVVVAKNEEEAVRLGQLFERGLTNGVDLEIYDADKLSKFEPLARTCSRFIWSPTTSIASPSAIVEALEDEFRNLGGKISYGQKIELKEICGEVRDQTNTFEAKHFINAAGAHAERISKSIGVGLEFSMIPFMGKYKTVNQSALPIRTLVYPVPHKINPFLGTHLTLTMNGKVKIGPSAIPIFGREQYSMYSGWNINDFYQSVRGISALARGESHSLWEMTKSEFPNLFTSNLVKESSKLVGDVLKVKKWAKKPPGIRAQLVHLPSGTLEQDFIVLSHLNSTHVLNAVSPGWTSALPFARFIVENLDKTKGVTK
jgi:L-2-hydroxyglutarate oxidase LhgO